MTVLKYDDLIKKLRDLNKYFCIFERSYVVQHLTLWLNKKPIKRRHENKSIYIRNIAWISNIANTV